jgi:hypothetical protein
MNMDKTVAIRILKTLDTNCRIKLMIQWLNMWMDVYLGSEINSEGKMNGEIKR